MPPESVPVARPRLDKVQIVANLAAGSVGPDAADQLAAVMSEFGSSVTINTPEPADLRACLRSAIDAGPDLLVVLAGDGTARAAAELCGPDGPLLAPLAGGTMNMLPHAVYGIRPWADALRGALTDGEERMLGGGEVEGHRFLCAAILGSSALWGPAREAVRKGKIRLALTRAQRAMQRTFTGRLRYALDGHAIEKTGTLILMCPIASRALDEDANTLEVAALQVEHAGVALRLGATALMGDWRQDPSVETRACTFARIFSSQAIPAILDGEIVSLGRLTEVRYNPKVVRVLAPPRTDK